MFRYGTPPKHTINDETIPAWLKGVLRYQQSNYKRPPCPHPVIWSKQGVACFEIKQHSVKEISDSAPVILFIPSLINRYYILDLTPELSLLDYVSNSGVHTYCVDWGEPDIMHDQTDAEAYIVRYLQPLIEHLSKLHSKPVIVAGYCIGGLLALGLARIMQHNISALIVLATPWDFEAHPHSKEKIHRLRQSMAYTCCDMQPKFSGAYISWLFYLADSAAFAEKYRQFSLLSPDSEAYARFIAVEYWVNDTIPITRAFAHNCLIDWAVDNQSAKLKWKIQGTIVDPSEIACPVLVVAPTRDRIVPHQSATALFPLLKNATLLTPDTGHIGMIIGHKRLCALWQPLIAWIHKTHSV